jgi:hypothetical protein
LKTRSANFICYFLFSLFIVYYLQGSLYPSGSIISQFSILLIFIVSGIYFVKTLVMKNKNNLFYYAWTALVLLNIIGFIMTADFSNDGHRLMFKEIMGCMLPFYPIYYFAKTDKIKASALVLFFLIMLPVVILQFILNKNQLISLNDYDDPNEVNNVAYLFVALVPFVFFIRNKVFAAALMGLLIIFVIQGAKRGAFVSCFIGLLFYFYYQIKTLESHKRFRGFLVALIVMIVLSAFAYKVFISNEFLINRMISISEGDVGNRNIIYKEIINKWYNSESVWTFISGFGFAGSLNLTGEFAHNDWLELLSNFGFIGICSYLFLFYSAVKCSLNNEWIQDKRILMFAIIMMWFFTTLISMWYTTIFYSAQAFILGYLIGGNNRNLE